MNVHVVALVGSLRAESYNKQLARTLAERYRNRMEIELLDIGLLPHFDQDLEQDPPPEVAEFKRRIKEADGVIIVTPEYNWSIPGVLKNALDWASRVDRVFIGKPVLILGATPGLLGTVRAQMHLREILASPGLQARVLPPGGNEVLINQAPQKFADGRLVDEATLTFLDGVVDKFLAFAAAE
nr:MAG: NADPH-dependent FMN reductase [Bacillota bacterium]